MTKQKIYYYTPNINFPSGGMGVLMKQALILFENGFDVSFLYQNNQSKTVFNPTWMDFSVHKIKKLCINDLLDIKFNEQDILVIPEGFGELIRYSELINCKKVVLAQSWIYILNSMSIPFTWDSVGVSYVISVSNGITSYINNLMPNVKVKQYKQSINLNLFYPEAKKENTIVFSASRGDEQLSKINTVIQYFKLKLPNSNFTFKRLNGLSRYSFAEALSVAKLCLYADEVAGFGTMPLEAMASNCHVVGFKNMGNSEYVTDLNGFWVDNGDYIGLANKLVEVVGLLDNDNIDKSLLQEEINTAEMYNEEQEIESVLSIFKEIINN